MPPMKIADKVVDLRIINIAIADCVSLCCINSSYQLSTVVHMSV